MYHTGSKVDQAKFEEQIALIEEIIAQNENKGAEVIVVGDFNTDINKETMNSSRLFEALAKLNHSLKDVEMYTKQPQAFTFESKCTKRKRSWIDHVMYNISNKSLLSALILVEDNCFSDHFPISIEYTLISSSQFDSLYVKESKKRVNYNWYNTKFVKNFSDRVRKAIETLKPVWVRYQKSINKVEKIDIITEIYGKLSHGISRAAEAAHNELEFTNRNPRRKRKLKSWWDKDLEECHQELCSAYRQKKDFEISMELDDVNDQRKHSQLVAIWKENKKAFRIRKRFNRKARREQNLKHVDELFKKNKNEFWKEVKKIERKNTTSVNIPVDQVKDAYEKVFTEKNTQWDDSDKLAEEKIKRLFQKLENESQSLISLFFDSNSIYLDFSM